ncbi:MAG TPA: hypothetical protein VIR16_03705 [Candidatus Limnocylindrales bacterium]
MTEQPLDANEPTPESSPPGNGMADEPIPDAASTRAREWLAQLEAMIQNIAREAAPVARDVGAKAAELAAVAAVKAGPIAQKAAEATVEYGQRFAEKAHTVAADWRSENAAAKATGETGVSGEPPLEPPSELSGGTLP